MNNNPEKENKIEVPVGTIIGQIKSLYNYDRYTTDPLIKYVIDKYKKAGVDPRQFLAEDFIEKGVGVVSKGEHEFLIRNFISCVALSSEILDSAPDSSLIMSYYPTGVDWSNEQIEVIPQEVMAKIQQKKSVLFSFHMLMDISDEISPALSISNRLRLKDVVAKFNLSSYGNVGIVGKLSDTNFASDIEKLFSTLNLQNEFTSGDIVGVVAGIVHDQGIIDEAIASGCNKLIVGNFTGKLSESESKKLKIISIGHENSISFGMKDILEKLSLEYSVPGSYR